MYSRWQWCVRSFVGAHEKGRVKAHGSLSKPHNSSRCRLYRFARLLSQSALVLPLTSSALWTHPPTTRCHVTVLSMKFVFANVLPTHSPLPPIKSTLPVCCYPPNRKDRQTAEKHITEPVGGYGAEEEEEHVGWKAGGGWFDSCESLLWI